MPLLKLRRQKDTGKGELQELLKRAKPLPNIFKPDWLDELDDGLVGWVVMNAETWKPKRSPAAIEGRPLPEAVELNGAYYAGLIIMNDGRTYLADKVAYEIMALADGSMTLNDIVAKLVAELAEDEPKVKEALEKNNREVLRDVFSVFYVAAAMLRDKGLLV